jgi:hypothetical protein
VYLGAYKPYETRFELRVDYFNETMVFVLLYHLMLFTREHIDLSDLRYAGGVSLIISTLVLVLTNIGLIAFPHLHRCRLKLKKKYYQNKANRFRD